MQIAVTALALVLGCALGSFLNVVLTRVPKGESVVLPGSHCRSCGRALEWWENVPVISWIALRGRCRTCHKPIGVRHVLVELGCGVAAAAAVQCWPLVRSRG